MPSTFNARLGVLSLTLIAASTLCLLALNLSGPPGTGLNGYGWRDIYVWHPVFM